MTNTNRWKFRVWDNIIGYSYFTLGEYPVPQREEYEQCTGLVDNTGGLIYEGDYIMEANGDVYKVVWDDDLCQFTAIGEGDPAVDFVKVFPFMADTVKDVYISGNIHIGKQINAFWCDDNHSTMVG